ncbi:MAG: hypothetical protein NTV54_13515 [Ignavibacteriales bacterium]|nr:hypothetical protein [Ignavibacteriales bacterium]
MEKIEVPRDVLTGIVEENVRLSAMAREMERVLDWYKEHPHYPLDYEKVKGRVVEVHARIDRVATLLREYVPAGTPAR